jgi:hypothetical protein
MCSALMLFSQHWCLTTAHVFIAFRTVDTADSLDGLETLVYLATWDQSIVFAVVFLEIFTPLVADLMLVRVSGTETLFSPLTAWCGIRHTERGFFGRSLISSWFYPFLCGLQMLVCRFFELIS